MTGTPPPPNYLAPAAQIQQAGQEMAGSLSELYRIGTEVQNQINQYPAQTTSQPK